MIFYLFISFILSPLLMFLSKGMCWVLGVHIQEKTIVMLNRCLHGFLFINILFQIGFLLQEDSMRFKLNCGHWYRFEEYQFQLVFQLDVLAIMMLFLVALLVGVVSEFSARYIHREKGFSRFFMLMHLYTFGIILVFSAGSLDLLLAGWELVGISSVFLISFFNYRSAPVKNALRVFASYRIADVGLLIALFIGHHFYKNTLWLSINHSNLDCENKNFLEILLVLGIIIAACGKSSQGPFMGWLPRAMEGPTPSSAIFYGALSIHAGAYLFLRIEPVLMKHVFSRWLVAFIGLTTALLATVIHRTCYDAKSSVAYASMTQVGVIFFEISMGWRTLAMVHLFSHIVLRTLQFLRTPSWMHDNHQWHADIAGKPIHTKGVHAMFLPKFMLKILYIIGLEKGYYDIIVDRFILVPTNKLAIALRKLDLSTYFK
jgi:NADH:ubiquinone oxidoreductase subunit 5 (subunit L)/multisubunit Na+/H+ antiporter MnhA subunit